MAKNSWLNLHIRFKFKAGLYLLVVLLYIFISHYKISSIIYIVTLPYSKQQFCTVCILPYHDTTYEYLFITAIVIPSARNISSRRYIDFWRTFDRVKISRF